jgi:hypothetical protein
LIDPKPGFAASTAVADAAPRESQNVKSSVPLEGTCAPLLSKVTVTGVVPARFALRVERESIAGSILTEAPVPVQHTFQPPAQLPFAVTLTPVGEFCLTASLRA